MEKEKMKKYIVMSLLSLCSCRVVQATSTLENNLVECTISTENKFEEIILKFVQTEDGNQNIYSDYALDYTYGGLSGVSSDLLGVHEQLRERLFVSSNAEEDGVLTNGRGDYQVISNYEHSQLIVHLEYQGHNQYNFPTYSLSLDGEGPVFELVYERYNDALDQSELYRPYDAPLCVSHFNLDDFITD